MRRLKRIILRGIAHTGKWIGWLFDCPYKHEKFQQILVFQAGGIGDIIRAFPIITSLHQRFPEASIFTLTPFSNVVFKFFPLSSIIKERISFDPEGEHRSIIDKWLLAKKLRNYNFDLIINTGRGEGMIENAIMSFGIGAPCRVGFEIDGAGFINTVKVPFQDNSSILQQNLNLIRALGITHVTEEISLLIPEEDLSSTSRYIKQHLSSGELLIALQPGSHWRNQLQWPLQRYIDLIEKLLRQFPCRVVLLGTKGEVPLGKKVQDAINDQALINMVGTTSLTQVAALLNSANLFIGHDSGLLHIALALKIPTVGIFGFTSPQQVIAPEGPCIALHKAIDEDLYYHQPFHSFKLNKPNPIKLITVSDVLQASKALMDNDTSV